MNDKKEFPIKNLTVVLARAVGYTMSSWIPVVFKRIETEAESDCWVGHFITYAGDFEEIAPLPGNESAILTDDDVFDLWDSARLENGGFV